MSVSTEEATNTDYILDYLRRTLMNYRTTRDGDAMTTPVSLIRDRRR